MNAPTVRVEWPEEDRPFVLGAARANARTLADRFAHAGRPLNTRCGQRNLCSGCAVQLVAGRFRMRDGTEISGPAELKACQGDLVAGVAADTTVMP